MFQTYYKLTDADKLLKPRRLCRNLQVEEFETVLQMAYDLKYDEEPMYDKMKFELTKIVLL